MTVQEDILPIPKMALALILFALGSLTSVLCGQFIYLAVQDHENQGKLVREGAGMEQVILEQKLQISEYRFVDEAKTRLAIPINDAKKLVIHDLTQGSH